MELIFPENNLTVKALSANDELEAAFRLRHEVFSRELKWVPESPDGMERDRYDAFSDYIGVFDLEGTLIGQIRLTPAPNPFMIEKEFLGLVPDPGLIKNGRDAGEVTRLCVREEFRSVGLKPSIPQLLYKGMYHWSLRRDIRYLMIVVDNRCYRHLRMSGLHVEALGEFVTMPDGVKAAACQIDWRKFEEMAASAKPGLLEWMSTLPVPMLSLSPEHGFYSRH